MKENINRVLMVLLAVFAVTTPAVLAATTFNTATTGGVFEASASGPAVTLGTNIQLASGQPVTDANTLRLETETQGNVTFSSPGATNATIDQFEGTNTQLSELDTSSANLTVDPDDKPKITIGGGITALDFSDMQLEDGTVDFSYSASSSGTLVVRDLAADTNITAVDGTGTTLDATSTNATGAATLSMPSGTFDVKLQNNDPPALDNASATPKNNKLLLQENVTLSINVNDDDFPGDNVTVDFYVNDSQVGSQTLTDTGTASVTANFLATGSHEWYAVATDEVGESVQSQTFEFRTEQELEIRPVDNTSKLLDNETVDVDVFFNDGTLKELNTTTGLLDISNLAVTDETTFVFTANNYSRTAMRFGNLSKQNTAYMLHINESSVNVTFKIDDNTGNFDAKNTTLRIQRGLTVNGTFQYVTVNSDEFGVDGVDTVLERDIRYRLIVENELGDTRVVGAYTATESETVILTIGEVIAAPDDNQSAYEYNASYKNVSGPNSVIFEFNTSNTAADYLNITIYEQGNRSNEIYQVNHSFVNSLAINQSVPANQDNRTWVVLVNGRHAGEDFTIKEIVGPRRPQLGGLDGWIRVAISLASIWIVAGLFSQLNSSIGAVVVAALGGMWYFVGFLPEDTGPGIVVLAFFTAFVLYMRDKGTGSI